MERKKGGKYVFAPLKNDRARTITPAPFVMKLLKRHRAKQAEQRLKLGPMWEDSGLVFTTETGRHLDLHTIQRAYKPIVASIGCPEARFHDLRHPYVKPTTKIFTIFLRNVYDEMTQKNCI